MDDPLDSEGSLGEEVEESDLQSQVGMGRRFFPAASQDIRVVEQPAIPRRAGSLEVKVPLADQRMLRVGQIEGLGVKGSRGLELLAGLVDRNDVDDNALIAGLIGIEMGAAGEAAQLQPVRSEQFGQPRCGQRRQHASVVAQALDDVLLRLVLAPQFGDLHLEGLDLFAQFDVRLIGRAASDAEGSAGDEGREFRDGSDAQRIHLRNDE